MAILFKATKMLESKIDHFLDAVSEGNLVFKQGIQDYLENNHNRFAEHVAHINRLEEAADKLRREIESALYEQSLIPEQRGDVMRLLEASDDVIDTAKEVLLQLDIQQPRFPREITGDLRRLSEQVMQAAEALVLAARAFFRNISAVKDHLHKVYFFEREADNLGMTLMRTIYGGSASLAEKNHWRYFITVIDSLADKAEAVADLLGIYTIKRTL